MQQHGQNYAGDSESLQADVMRFMAIIAFCLIAILALVKNTEPDASPVDPSDQAIPPAQPEVAMVTPEPAPWAAMDPEPEAPGTTAETAAEPPADLQPATAPGRPEQAATEPVVAEPAAVEPARVEPPAGRPDAASPEPVDAAEPAAQPAEEEGLILRFASDGDFLRLIARGDIRVYAFQDSDVLSLNESYRFLDTTAPGQVYELLPPSIPSLVLDALRQARPETDGYRWGIALPGRISHQIERHLNRVKQGELVIDRYGDVRHVAAS
jgi:hypothetical protein